MVGVPDRYRWAPGPPWCTVMFVCLCFVFCVIVIVIVIVIIVAAAAVAAAAVVVVVVVCALHRQTCKARVSLPQSPL